MVMQPVSRADRDARTTIKNPLADEEFSFVLHRVVESAFLPRQFNVLDEDTPRRQLNDGLAEACHRFHPAYRDSTQKALDAPLQRRTHAYYFPQVPECLLTKQRSMLSKRGSVNRSNNMLRKMTKNKAVVDQENPCLKPVLT